MPLSKIKETRVSFDKDQIAARQKKNQEREEAYYNNPFNYKRKNNVGRITSPNSDQNNFDMACPSC
jgi:hypothetical protein